MKHRSAATAFFHSDPSALLSALYSCYKQTKEIAPTSLRFVYTQDNSHCVLPQPCYRPQRSCGQGNVFTGVCLSTGGGRVSASVHAGIPDPPRTRQTPQTRQPPPGPGSPPLHQAPPRTRQTSPGPGIHPPRTRQTPPGKQTAAYGLRAAGTHPTGMHSCIHVANKRMKFC